MAPGELLRDVVRRGNTRDPTRTLHLSALSIMCIDLFNIAPQVNDQLEVVPANVFTLHMSRQSGSGDFGESGTFGRVCSLCRDPLCNPPVESSWQVLQ